MRLGAQNVVTTTRGTLYFDNFESRRFSYIGTLPPPDLPQPQLPNNPGWTPTNYTYSTAHPHAATAAGANTYSYDANGNMTCRVENGDVFIQSYNAENRLASVTKVAIISQIWNGICPSPITYAAQWDFAYDGDGTRVTQLYTPYDSNGNPQTPVLTVYFMGGAYEVTGGAVKKYYAIAGMTVAMNDGTGLKYLLTDHLGSVVGITDSSGTLISQQRYLPFGQVRTDVGSITQTDLSYTGQRSLGMGLMDYKARMYDSYLNRFIQPDVLLPSADNPQTWNRYSYVANRPVRFTDPTGHCLEEGDAPPGRLRQNICPKPPPPPAPGIDKEHDKKLRQIKKLAELLSVRVQKGAITDLDALKLLLKFAAVLYGDDKRGALMDLGIVVGGLDTTGTTGAIRPPQIDEHSALYQYYVGYDAFVVPRGGSTGFASNLNPNSDNQVRHFFAGAAGSSFRGGFGELGMYGNEIWQGLRSRNHQIAWEDMRLYERAFAFTAFLFGSPQDHVSGHPLSEAGDWVQENLGP